MHRARRQTRLWLLAGLIILTMGHQLRAQDKEFIVNIEKEIMKSRKEVEREWQDGVKLWNSGAIGQETWENSRISKNRMRLLVAMKAKGFVFSQNFN